MSSPTTPATPTDWCRFTSLARRPTWAPSWARTADIATRRRSRPPTAFCPKIRSTRRPIYADQSDLYWVQKEAVARGAKHLFIVWFDGLDWPTTQAAAIVKTGKVYTEGKGSGLVFQDYDAGGTAQYGFVVTSPTHDQNRPDVNTQTIVIPATSVGGGYDARIAGPNPWTLGPLGPKAPGYFKGQSANERDRAGVLAVGGVLHAYTDSSQSAAEMISGIKSYNNGVNITDDGRIVTTLFHELQDQGWKVGTVTSVPFDHVSPAAMYAQDVYRDDYQDLAREMLGLPGILQQARQAPLRPGLDVVMGTGFGVITNPKSLAAQGKNGVLGSLFITDADLAAIDIKNGGKYVVTHTEPGASGGQALTASRRCWRPGDPRGSLASSAARTRSSSLPDRRRTLRPRTQHRQQRRTASGRVVHARRPGRTADPGPDDRGRPRPCWAQSPTSRSPCSSKPATLISHSTPITSTTPSARSLAAKRPSGPSSTGSNPIATGTTPS